jgi:hypothetical protein
MTKQITKIKNMPLHPEVGVKVSKHRNQDFEVLAIVALSLVSVLAAYTMIGSATDVLQESANAGVAAYRS